MDFAFTEEQEALHAAAVAFAERELAGEPPPALDAALWRRCAEFGLAGLTVRRDLGGQGHDAVTAARVLEGVGYGASSTAPAFALAAHLLAVAMPVQAFGDEALARDVLPALCDGRLVGVHAATEPEAGSDSANVRTTATRDGDGGYVLDGLKTYVTNAPLADVLLVTASTDRARGFQGLSAFLVDRATPGLRVGPPMGKMGLAAAEMAEVYLDGCRIPASRRVGGEGQGSVVFRVAMEWERALILAPQVGAMARQLERTIEHARSRRQFGRRIGSFQGVSHRVAQMALRLETARLLLYKAAWCLNRERGAALGAALAKVGISEAAVATHLDALRVHGGAGYVQDLPVERDVRDAIGTLIHSGTSEIQYNLVASLLGL